MARAEAPFRQQPLPPSEPRLTVREGARILMSELQGQTINLRQVLESGVVADHAHCSNVLDIGVGSKAIFYDPEEYKHYFLEYGITGWIALHPPSNKVTVYRMGQTWPAQGVVEAFPSIDFESPFAKPNGDIYHGLPINTTRTEGKSELYELDVPLGDNVPRSELVLTRKLIGHKDFSKDFSIDDFDITDRGNKLITALLAARV